MAEGKKSFLLYADYIHTFEHLSDEEAGKLIKILFQYVNDQDPPIEDKLLKIAFEPIKRQLKRDLTDWENEKEKRSDNASLGNLKRWRPDLYDKVKTGEMNIENAFVIAFGRTRSGTIDGDGTGSNTIAMVADNVTVTDTVNVTVIDTDTVIPQMFAAFKKALPKYPGSEDMDFKPLLKIATFISKQLNLKGDVSIQKNKKAILAEWNILCGFIVKDSFYKLKPLSVIASQVQGVWQLKDKNQASSTGIVEVPKSKNYYKKNRE